MQSIYTLTSRCRLENSMNAAPFLSSCAFMLVGTGAPMHKSSTHWNSVLIPPSKQTQHLKGLKPTALGHDTFGGSYCTNVFEDGWDDIHSEAFALYTTIAMWLLATLLRCVAGGSAAHHCLSSAHCIRRHESILPASLWEMPERDDDHACAHCNACGRHTVTQWC